MANLERVVKIDGKFMTHIGTKSGIELYQDDSEEGVLYGVIGDNVMFTVIASQSDEGLTFALEQTDS